MASPAYRFIDGALYRRHTTPYAFDLRIHDLGGGHNESLVLPRYGWSEVDASERCLADAAMSQGHIWDQENGVWVPSTVSAAEQAQKDADNKERSVRRVRTKVRRLIKSKDLNTMLTLTYRENMVDRARMQRDFDVFMKRVRRIFPGFQYVCVFERQKRGAWHAHIAVHRLLSHYVVKGVMVKSYDLLRTVWRAVVGRETSMYRRLFVAVVALLRSSLPTCLSTSQKVLKSVRVGTLTALVARVCLLR